MLSFKSKKTSFAFIIAACFLFTTVSYADSLRSIFNITTLPKSARMHAGETVRYVYTVTNPADSGITVRPTSIKISSSATAQTTVPQVQTSIIANTCNAAMAPGASCTVTVTATAPQTPGDYKLSLSVQTAGGAGGGNGRSNPFTLTEPSTPGCTGPNGACIIIATTTTFTGNLAPQVSNFQAEILNQCGPSNTDGNTLSYANCICEVEGRSISQGTWRALLSITNVVATTNVRYTNTRQVIRPDGRVVIAAGGGLYTYPHSEGVQDGGLFCVRTGQTSDGQTIPGCSNYTDSSVGVIRGTVGNATSQEKQWVQEDILCRLSCDAATAGIYCMESP